MAPLSLGYDIESKEKSAIENFDRYLYPEYYDSYNTEEIPSFIEYQNYDVSNKHVDTAAKESNPIEMTTQPLDGPMDSAWPMHGHDTRHTGRSSYSTVDTWDEIWNFETSGWALCSPAIDEDGTIYIGSFDFYAVNPDGTEKWKFSSGRIEASCPAIDENGIIYVGTHSGGFLYAIYPNGSLKWKYPVGSVDSSPSIGDDGTIYFADSSNIKALYPNGTLKWSFPTNHVIYSSPAIGLDGTIYCGSHDDHVYALYPNNGTLKWKYNTGNWVHGSPTIADDGTVYIGSDNGYLYAFYPNNGTIKWKVNIGAVYASLALDEDGTIYVGVWENKFYAINPDGTVKWSFDTGAHVWGSSPALSDDDTLYFGTCNLDWTGGIEIIALYTDSTVKWRKGLDTVFSSPAISSDGTVYIGSCGPPGEGFLNAFGVEELEADANGPYYDLINQPIQFTGTSSGGYSPHSYHWDFGDTYTSEEQNPLHTYTSSGNYDVVLTVTDNEDNTAIDTTFAWIQTSNTPPNKPTINGPTSGNAGTSYPYTFTANDPDESSIYYYIDWGDSSNSGWLGPYDSDETITESHTWSSQGTFTISAKAKDPYNEEGPWGEFSVNMKVRNRAYSNTLLLRFLEQFPFLERFLTLLIK